MNPETFQNDVNMVYNYAVLFEDETVEKKNKSKRGAPFTQLLLYNFMEVSRIIAENLGICYVWHMVTES